MKNEADNIDQLIKDTLTSEEAEFYEKLDEPGLFEMVGGMFKGKMKWFAVITIVVQLAFIVLAVISLLEMLDATNTRDTVLWAVALIYCTMTVSMLKIWHWMQMDKYALMKEVKRLELQVSVLVSHVTKSEKEEK